MNTTEKEKDKTIRKTYKTIDEQIEYLRINKNIKIEKNKKILRRKKLHFNH